MHQRDYFSHSTRLSLIEFYKTPVREFLKICKLLFKIFQYKTFNFFSPKIYKKKLKKNHSFARSRNAEYYIANNDYFEISIGNQTRPVAFFNNTFSFEQKITPTDEFIFGLAPNLNEMDISKIKKWGFELTIASVSSKALKKTYYADFPYNGRTECYAYFADNGWIDFKVDLNFFSNHVCKFTLKVNCINSRGKVLGNVNFSISHPQLIDNIPNKQKNIILISGESLTDLHYLKNNYDEATFPNLSNFIKESTVYPKTYSPADNTLSYGASILSGLMPSQHCIGDYSKMPWNFDNQIINSQIVNLPEFLKKEGFFNIFGGTETRFSSKVGWAKGFDHYFHVYEKWSQNIPKVDWLHRIFQSYDSLNKFIMVHLDYLHEPLVSFNDLERPRVFDLSLIDKTKNDRTRELYFEQLKFLDNQLGTFFNELKHKGVYDNTAIIITGDHGAGINWVKHNTYSLYEERIRVPLIIKYPLWAKYQKTPTEISNSCFEIHKIIYSMLGKRLPSYLDGLPQYNKEFEEFAFSETIMNPNKDYKSHKIAVINNDYKYVAWNKIDWNLSKIEKSFIDEKLFIWNENKSTFNEEENLLSKNISLSKKYQKITREIINQNLHFNKIYKPETF